MIFKHKIDQLTEEEMCILMHVMNEHFSDGIKWEPEYINCVKPKELFTILNSYAPKIREDKRTTLQSIVDKIIG